MSLRVGKARLQSCTHTCFSRTGVSNLFLSEPVCPARAHRDRGAMAGIRLSVFYSRAPVLSLQQVKAEPWTVWACEGFSSSLSYPPHPGEVCCKYEGDRTGAFTTHVRRCAPPGINRPQTGTECASCESRCAARPHRLLPRVYGGVEAWKGQGYQLHQPRRLRRVWGQVSWG